MSKYVLTMKLSNKYFFTRKSFLFEKEKFYPIQYDDFAAVH